jgi:hypothetical protein
LNTLIDLLGSNKPFSKEDFGRKGYYRVIYYNVIGGA